MTTLIHFLSRLLSPSDAREAFLAQASDQADLENRIRRLERTQHLGW